MELTLQLKGPLKKYGPGEEIFPYRVESERFTMLDLIGQLNIPASSVSFVKINDQKKGFDHPIEGGDSIVIYPRVAGG